MRWIVYNLLFAFVYTAMMPVFLFRMKRRGGYRERMGDRFGCYPDGIARQLRDMRGAVWIHAVSVGEVYVAGQVMRALRERIPSLRFVFSTTSSTGWREAEKQLGTSDVLIYNPLDFPVCVRRAMSRIRPAALILTESEIWPNLIRACHGCGVPLYLVNARVSDRSAPGYRRLRFWFGPVLRKFTAILAQSEEDRRRLVAAGADPARVEVTGSFKFDVANRDPEAEKAVAAYLDRWDAGAGRVVLLGGSIWPGEDVVLITLYARLRRIFPALRLVLVPRHFEKADTVEAAIRRAGFACARKSRTPLPEEGTGAPEGGATIVLGDTTGELMGFYGNAALVFVGKSLCEHGAQNMIEPCLCGAATLIGPHTENFRPVVSDLLEAGALIQVPDAEALEREIARLLADDAARRALGERASAAVLRRKGVVGRCADTLAAELRKTGCVR
ncbi:MAG TPA: 3-deoxy-D-manno-octulosonic acid transferase [Kiritimatiellia bacterium]|mgnify:CR=1 FL=1|nr:3-deoxy-D-manno-octulosonic acid transferase [Kiritimatiellia bacterium]HOM58418.1 3-deoxy-D-manno-octulosonic acid transferase [Kiritimatiellia bacterium]HOR98304.1 3-deoxy-D-manno-octulosonic acid transferase [Kiritimatiellia bacterium]HPC48880.1 3-deoxy-D-manno-octulosonic acid transferase [Kiritimatiellia bacterium]